MKQITKLSTLILGLTIPIMATAFDSGSTGADGALNITADTELQSPPSGIFNFTDVNIATGVTLSFTKNASNTPVVILASGDITIIGTLDVSGGVSNITGDTDRTGDGFPGIGGPGGYDGGRGGFRTGPDPATDDGAPGQGPGGGAAHTATGLLGGNGGAGGGYSVAGQNGRNNIDTTVPGGSAYGVTSLVQLIGGSGGGGGAGGASFTGSGGGGGGGAILIAASGTVIISGLINARGGPSGASQIGGNGRNGGGTGGGGSGGAVRIIATTIDGGGTIAATRALAGTSTAGECGASCLGGDGANGRIRLETENMLFGGITGPTFSFAAPNPVFFPNIPNIQIASVGGINAPGVPTGSNDIVLPSTATNPTAITFVTSNVPAGSTITLDAIPKVGTTVTASSTPVAGNAATASINIPNGPSVLIARTSFTVTASLGSDFSKYAKGEQVEKVEVALTASGDSETTFITISGKAFTWPSNAIAMN